jgi:spore germination protein GerM
MNKTTLLALASTAMLLAGAPAIAQKMEAVHRLSYDSTEQAEAALGALMQDPATSSSRTSTTIPRT